MRVLTYNVHSCRGVDGRLMPERIAEVIAGTGAEVVCLQEIDVWRQRTGKVHQAEVIAKELGMKYQFYPAIRAETEEYGDAILSRHPMKPVRTGGLPRPKGSLEPRGAIWVEIENGGTSWQVLNTHLGLGRYERRIQAMELANWLKEALAKPPVVFCGDLNSRSASRVHHLLGSGLREVQSAVRSSRQKTFSTWIPWICLDYIYVSSEVTVTDASVINNPLARVASDHFPLLTEVNIP